MTKKEKIITEVIYMEYQKSGSRSMKWPDLVSKLKGQLTGPEIAPMFYNDYSKYFKWDGIPEIIVQITSNGIEYMENIPKYKAEQNYKNAILAFAGVQVLIALLQLIQSTIDSEFTMGRIISFIGLLAIAIFLWFFYKETK